MTQTDAAVSAVLHQLDSVKMLWTTFNGILPLGKKIEVNRQLASRRISDKNLYAKFYLMRLMKTLSNCNIQIEDKNAPPNCEFDEEFINLQKVRGSPIFVTFNEYSILQNIESKQDFEMNWIQLFYFNHGSSEEDVFDHERIIKHFQRWKHSKRGWEFLFHDFVMHLGGVPLAYESSGICLEEWGSSELKETLDFVDGFNEDASPSPDFPSMQRRLFPFTLGVNEIPENIMKQVSKKMMAKMTKKTIKEIATTVQTESQDGGIARRSRIRCSPIEDHTSEKIVILQEPQDGNTRGKQTVSETRISQTFVDKTKEKPKTSTMELEIDGKSNIKAVVSTFEDMIESKYAFYAYKIGYLPSVQGSKGEPQPAIIKLGIPLQSKMASASFSVDKCRFSEVVPIAIVPFEFEKVSANHALVSDMIKKMIGTPDPPKESNNNAKDGPAVNVGKQEQKEPETFSFEMKEDPNMKGDWEKMCYINKIIYRFDKQAQVATSIRSDEFYYQVGAPIIDPDFDPNPNVICTNGIHAMLNQPDAIEFWCGSCHPILRVMIQGHDELASME